MHRIPSRKIFKLWTKRYLCVGCEESTNSVGMLTMKLAQSNCYLNRIHSTMEHFPPKNNQKTAAYRCALILNEHSINILSGNDFHSIRCWYYRIMNAAHKKLCRKLFKFINSQLDTANFGPLYLEMRSKWNKIRVTRWVHTTLINFYRHKLLYHIISALISVIISVNLHAPRFHSMLHVEIYIISTAYQCRQIVFKHKMCMERAW